MKVTINYMCVLYDGSDDEIKQFNRITCVSAYLRMHEIKVIIIGFLHTFLCHVVTFAFIVNNNSELGVRCTRDVM